MNTVINYLVKIQAILLIYNIYKIFELLPLNDQSKLCNSTSPDLNSLCFKVSNLSAYCQIASQFFSHISISSAPDYFSNVAALQGWGRLTSSLSVFLSRAQTSSHDTVPPPKCANQVVQSTPAWYECVPHEERTVCHHDHNQPERNWKYESVTPSLTSSGFCSIGSLCFGTVQCQCTKKKTSTQSRTISEYWKTLESGRKF